MRAPLLAALLALPLAAPALDVPGLTGPVVDQAGVLPRGDVARLEQLARSARAVHGGTGVQLQYLLVRSLDGEALEDYSMKVAEAWKLGGRQEGNGVLVLVALGDRKVRIEVGQGIEGGLTDVQSSRIIRQTIAPAFRERRYGDGLYQAGVQVLSALGALPADVAPRPVGRPSAGTGLTLGVVALVVAFLVLRSLLFGFTGRRRSGWWGGPFGGGGWGGGGFGGGGSSGGGWSGGGGGFSGGGASGGW
jgi:uncharacterized protein